MTVVIPPLVIGLEGVAIGLLGPMGDAAPEKVGSVFTELELEATLDVTTLVPGMTDETLTCAIELEELVLVHV